MCIGYVGDPLPDRTKIKPYGLTREVVREFCWIVARNNHRTTSLPLRDSPLSPVTTICQPLDQRDKGICACPALLRQAPCCKLKGMNAVRTFIDGGNASIAPAL